MKNSSFVKWKTLYGPNPFRNPGANSQAAMRCKHIPSWIRSMNLDLMPASAVPGEMKKKQGPRKEFFLSEMNSASGIQRDKDLNSGTSTTGKFRKEKMCAHSRSATGQNSIS